MWVLSRDIQQITFRAISIIWTFFATITLAAQENVYSAQSIKSEIRNFRIYYPVNKTALYPNYMSNAQNIDTIRRYLAESPRIDSIVIYSYASPEGPYRFNSRLAKGRGKTAKRFIMSLMPADRQLPDSIIHLRPEAENWQGLREEIVANYHLGDRDRVLEILDSDIANEEKKTRLKRLSGGKAWRHIIKTIMPRLRYATWISVWQPILPELPPAEIVKEVPSVNLRRIDTDFVPAPEIIFEPETEMEPMLSVKTNLLYDLFYMPNYGFAPAPNIKVEYYPRNSRWTFAGEYDFPWWKKDSKHKYFQILNWQLEARRYFKHDGTHTQHYLYGYLMTNLYDIGFDKEKGWQGEGYGLGLGYGYALPLGEKSKWKLDFNIQLGYLLSNFDPYHAGQPYYGKYYYDWYGPIDSFKRRNQRLHYFGITGVGVSLSYDLLWRDKKYKSKNNGYGK